MTRSTPPPEPPIRADMDATTDESQLRAFDALAGAELQLPVDAHVIGEPVTMTKIRP